MRRNSVIINFIVLTAAATAKKRALKRFRLMCEKGGLPAIIYQFMAMCLKEFLFCPAPGDVWLSVLQPIYHN